MESDLLSRLSSELSGRGQRFFCFSFSILQNEGWEVAGWEVCLYGTCALGLRIVFSRNTYCQHAKVCTSLLRHLGLREKTSVAFAGWLGPIGGIAQTAHVPMRLGFNAVTVEP